MKYNKLLWKMKVNQLLIRLGLREPDPIWYIGGSDVLPQPLPRAKEREVLEAMKNGDLGAKSTLIEHNLRLVVYINIEDLISIGTIGLIKAVNTFKVDKNIKLATYASRCIENEILMHLRKTANQKGEISLDEPLNTDWDGNELLLSDVLGTDSDLVVKPIEADVDRQMLREAMSHLNEREHLIISMRFGLEGRKTATQKEVADCMGISQSYISRLEKRIVSRLRREMLKMG